VIASLVVRSWLRLGVLASMLLSVAACDVPIGAIRRKPPAGIDARVLAAESQAPPVTLTGTGGPFVLADVVAHDNALLVFYRGHW
jgi:hypothetical protein